MTGSGQLLRTTATWPRFVTAILLLGASSVVSAEDFVLGIGTAFKQICNAERGICVTWVRPEGAAGRAGMKAGDVLVRLGDSAIADLRDVAPLLHNAPADLLLHAQVLRDGSILDLDVRFNSADKATNNANATFAPTSAAFEVLPATDTVVSAGDGLKEGETRIVQNNGVLTFAHRSAAEAVSVMGGSMQQLPMTRVAGTDIWILQLQRAAWDETFFSYAIMEGGQSVVGKLEYFRGTRAPMLPDEATELRGQLREETLHSRVLDQDRSVTVYLPPGRRRGPLPMILMADGQACREFARVAEPIILAGAVQPFAIVGVHASVSGLAVAAYDPTKDLRAREYLPMVDPSGVDRHLRFVTEEVLPWATKRFHLSSRREDRAITGFSNGAAFVVYAALTHGELFAHALPFSANYDGSDQKMSDQQRHDLPSFHFAAGELEPPFKKMSLLANAHVQESGGRSEIRIYDSGHDMLMWKRALVDYLPKVFPRHR